MRERGGGGGGKGEGRRQMEEHTDGWMAKRHRERDADSGSPNSPMSGERGWYRERRGEEKKEGGERGRDEWALGRWLAKGHRCI